MKKIILITTLLAMGSPLLAAQFDGTILEWNKDKESFKKPEESFQKTLKLLKENFADKNITEEDLYRAATAGMLAALNNDKESWNTLLTPLDMKERAIEVSGQVVGIGATLEFDASSNNAKVRGVVPGSGADRAGLKPLDQILSVNGRRFKELRPMVAAIRGKEGESVKLKVLREDRLLTVDVTRSSVKIPLTISANIDAHTGYLNISGFTEESLPDLKKSMQLFAGKAPLQKLIIDLRSNHGGVFDQARDVTAFFLKKNDVIVMTQLRDGSKKTYKAEGSAWSPETKILILTDKETSSSAEFFAESLRENRHAVIVGTETAGKWTVEMLEELPNHYYIKYSVMSLLSPSGKNFNEKGISPDFAFGKAAQSPDSFIGYEFTKDISKRIEVDPTLKAAVELPL